VAKEAGVAVGTVAQRFGSKHGLLVALTTTAIEAVRTDLREAVTGLDDHGHAAVHALVEWYRPLGDSATAPNNLAQLGFDLADERLRGLMGEFYAAMESEVAELLSGADLPSGPPTQVAARILTAIADGTALHWSTNPAGEFCERLEADLSAVLDGWGRANTEGTS
jgi:AcrR family transcriptional regulator